MGHTKYAPPDPTIMQRRVEHWNAIYQDATPEERTSMDTLLKIILRGYTAINMNGINGFGIESAKELAVAMAERTRATAKGRVMC